MARGKGTFNFAANFEVLAKAPLDARMVVGSYSDLILPATWEDGDGLVWLFDGALVVVSNDPSAGIYWLKDSANYTDYSSWEKAGTSDADASIGVINVGDGSANIFAGYDSSGNIQLRTLGGSGAALVTQIGDQIIIGLDASFSGEVNYGQNVGDGDASIYVQKVGDKLEFRELKSASSELLLDVSGNLVVFDTSISQAITEIQSLSPQLIVDSSGTIVTLDTSIAAPQGESIDGGVWITDINPQGSGNVGDKSYSSDGNVLDYCLTDTSALAVSVLALPGHTNYMPVVTINDVSVSLSEGDNQPLWVGTYNIQYDFADSSITVVHEDGASWSTTVDADTPAVIQSAEFTGGYPGSQTQLKAGDTYDVSIVTDVSISSVIVDNYGAATGGTYSVSGTNVGFTVTIADRGTSTQALGLRLRVVKPTGSTSANYLTENQGSVDGKDLVNLNNTYPTISFGSITYPFTQSAIKTSESATVNHTVTNFDTISYTSPTGELSIASPTSYQPGKIATYSSGTYNISTNNFTISANRAANDADSTSSTVVWIAAVAPTLSVSNPASRLRSGGNDGTSAQSHTITINSSQRLQSAPTLAKDTGGTWLGGGFSWSAPATSFTRSLQVHDDDSKGTYNWGAISGTGLAGLTSSTNTGDTQYVLGGFVQRTITVAAFGTSAQINVEISTYSKVSSTGSGQTLAWSVKDLTTRSTIGDTTGGQANTWSASATFTNPTTIYILDTAAAASSSQASTFTIQESI